MGFAVELYEYWRVHPPTHLILQAVYAKDPPRASSSNEFTESDRKDVVGLLHGPDALPAGALGVAREMPPHLVALADWAEEQLAKMKVH